MAHGNRTAGHPERSELEGFLLGKLDRTGRMAVLAHLVHGCDACQQTLAPLASFMWRPERSQPPREHSEAEYDAAIEKAFAALPAPAKQRPSKKRAPEAAELLSSAGHGEIAWALCESLLDESWEQRHHDPEAMVLLAAFAAMVAESIEPSTRGVAALADLQARAFADLGNARRVANDPVAADVDLLRARKRAERGTGDTMLLGRLLERTGALRIDQRRFDEAETLLEWALQVYETEGARHLTGKVLTQKAHLCLLTGKPEEAASLLMRALSFLDPVLEPSVLLVAVHNLLDCYVQCGRFREAWHLLWISRKLYAAYGGPVHQLRLLWIEGRVADGLGHAGRSERYFRQAQKGFLEMNLPYTAAVVATDLGILLLEKGRAAEARELIEETLETFNVLHIRREAVGAMILLSDAVQQETLSVAALRQLAAELQKIER
ncbi:MAG TPA: tetratricopeptide repeat protein [Thermoanaerobaculia bacterium]|nr:tetratricopeptide repeat protein [Thermoanaerobaculia bacterium]